MKTKYFKVGSLLLQELSCFLWLLGVGFAQSRVRRRRRSFSEMLGEERALACNHLLGLVASAAVFVVVGSLSLCSQLKRCRRDLDAFSSLTSTTSRVTYRNALVDRPKVTWQLQHYFSCEITILNFIGLREKKVRQSFT